MKILIALAAGLVATAAGAQMTTTTTTHSNPSRTSTTTRTVDSTHVHADNVPRADRRRVCTTKWRHHKRIRTCRMVVRR